MDDYNIIQLNNSQIIYDTLNIDILLEHITPDTSIIYFGSEIDEKSNLFNLHKNKQIDKLIIISNSKTNNNSKRLFISSKISKSILEHVKKHLLVIIKMDDNYNNVKNIIQNLILLKNFAKELNIELGVTFEEKNIIGFISKNNSQYFNDLCNALKSIYITDKRQKYEFIYDTVCNYLDSEFSKNNFCDFQNDKCIANRNNRSEHPNMGCCYSFQYAGFLEPRLIKNVKLCEHLNCKTCSTKCITCKLFTCKFLKEKNIKFNTHKILLLDCFFNRKQHLIIQSNFFKTKEEILNKLLEKNNSPYLWYFLRQKYKCQ